MPRLPRRVSLFVGDSFGLDEGRLMTPPVRQCLLQTQRHGSGPGQAPSAESSIAIPALFMLYILCFIPGKHMGPRATECPLRESTKQTRSPAQGRGYEDKKAVNHRPSPAVSGPGLPAAPSFVAPYSERRCTNPLLSKVAFSL